MNQRLQTTGDNGGISVNARGGGGAALVAVEGEGQVRELGQTPLLQQQYTVNKC